MAVHRNDTSEGAASEIIPVTGNVMRSVGMLVVTVYWSVADDRSIEPWGPSKVQSKPLTELPPLEGWIREKLLLPKTV